MAIKVGDKFPAVKLSRLGASGVEEVDTGEYFKNKRVVLFSLPGAFTPSCSKSHLPGFVARADEIKSKGIDEIVCLSVNDQFVMKAWFDDQKAHGKVSMLPDGSAALTKALGLELDLTAKGLGVRAKRASMVVDKGVVEELNIEPAASEVTISGADACAAKL
jgi:peroxiredoxin